MFIALIMELSGTPFPVVLTKYNTIIIFSSILKVFQRIKKHILVALLVNALCSHYQWKKWYEWCVLVHLFHRWLPQCTIPQNVICFNVAAPQSSVFFVKLS